MTLKNSFLKLLKEDMKRRIWAIALSMLAFFLLFTVVCAMSVSDFTYRSNQMGSDIYLMEWIHERVLRFMGPANELVLLITIGCAVICGISGFFYLHSKKKVDLYHSIPVKREKLFAVVYLNGLLIYLVPYIISLILCFIILGVNQYLQLEVFLAALTAFGVNILYYCLIYTIAIIAVMLTGNLVVSVLGTAVFYLYGSLIVAIKEMYHSQFFISYFSTENSDNRIINMSPLGNYINIAGRIAEGGGRDVLGTIVMVSIFTLVLVLTALFLYKKRPSEAAGKAMAFRVSQPIIKLALVIPVSLVGGILFMDVASGGNMAWFLFGLIFSLIVSHGIIEIIYHFDIRKAFHGKYYLLASAVVVGIIVCIFRYDLFHYDTYLPKKSDIKSMSVDIGGLDDHIRYFEFDSIKNRNIYDNNYELNRMEIRDFTSAYELAKYGIEHFKKYNKGKNEVRSLYEITEFGAKDAKYYLYKVKYRLNSGKEIYRQYMLPVKETYELLQDVYADMDFKKGHYPIYQWEATSIEGVSCHNEFENKEFSLDVNKKEQLLELYRADLKNLTLNDITHLQPVAKLTFEINNYNSNYYVYPTFANTITFLKDHGFDSTRVVEAKDVREIVVRNLNIKFEEAKVIINGAAYETAIAIPTMEAVNTDIEEEGTKNYSDLASIEEMIPSLVDYDYYWNNHVFIDVEDSVEVMVTIHLDEYGNHISNSYYFKAGEIPEFVKKDIRY